MSAVLITGSRADWNGLGMVGKALLKMDASVEVWAIGQQAEDDESLKTVIEDGFDPVVMNTNWKDDMGHGCALAAHSVNALIDKGHRPDVAIVLGDRFEILGAAAACALHRVPIVHIGGGDRTDGAIDNKLRYAISSLADMHCVTNHWSDHRLKSSHFLDNVHLTGNPAIDRIKERKKIARGELLLALGMDSGPKFALVACHSVTNSDVPTWDSNAMIAALDQLIGISFLVIGTNSDAGGAQITKELMSFVSRDLLRRKFVQNLSPTLFYGCLDHFDIMVGNSSAGVVESADFGIMVVNIGDRQRGRPTAANVLHCVGEVEPIISAVKMALTGRVNPMPNPYGDGNSAEKIASLIMEKWSPFNF